MSSGLPINTFNQAKEYRDRYLANLALEVQNDNYNLQANQVYKQTGQVARPPDMRSTTEKLADLEKLKVELRSKFGTISDQAGEVVDALTPDEIVFASQQADQIVSDLKPKFSKGVPSYALLGYIRQLRRKFMQTSGVSFTMQESTAEQLLNAVKKGVDILGANPGPFAPVIIQQQQQPMMPMPNQPARVITDNDLMQQEMADAEQRAKNTRAAELTQRARDWLQSGTQPFGTLAKNLQEEIRRLQATEFSKAPSGPSEVTPGVLGKFKKDPAILQLASQWKPTYEELDNFPASLPISRASNDYPADNPSLNIEFLKMWAKSQPAEVKARFEPNWDRKRRIDTLVKALKPGLDAMQGEEIEMVEFQPEANQPTSAPQLEGTGFRRIMLGPPSRMHGRTIVGKGLTKTESYARKRKPINIDESKGVSAKPTFVRFGKYVINTNKLGAGLIDIRTPNGAGIKRYPVKQLSMKLSKIINRIVGGRIPDIYDIQELDEDDNVYLYNLAMNSNINDRLNIPTPKRSKDSEEMNRFEILKGQIMAGNDNKELVKEFKQLLVKFSNEDRIKKSEAREILLDLAAIGY